jgi:hypothetical protein
MQLMPCVVWASSSSQLLGLSLCATSLEAFRAKYVPRSKRVAISEFMKEVLSFIALFHDSISSDTLLVIVHAAHYHSFHSHHCSCLVAMEGFDTAMMINL